MNSLTAVSFSDYYKTITDTELLSVLDNKDDYQEAAIEAAKQELERRQLSPNQLEDLKAQLAIKKEEKEFKKKQQEDVQQAIKNKSLSVLESLNPIHEELPAAEKILHYIIILWGIFALIDIITEYRVELNALQEFPFHPFVNSLVLFPCIILPVSLYYLWKRAPLGWTLFVVFLTFSLVFALWLFETALTWKPSGIRWMDAAFKPSVWKPLRELLMLGGTFYAMCRQDMRALFSIESKKMWTTIGITSAVAILCIVGLMYQ